MPNPVVLIEIKTIGGDKARREIRGLKQAVRGVAPATEKMGKAAAKTSTRMSKLGESTKNLSSSAVLAIGPLSGVGARIVALGSIAQRSALKMALFLAVFTGLTVLMIKAIKRASEAERAMLRLEAVIKATGRTSEITAIQINSFARTLGEATLTSQRAVREAAAVLLSFSNVGVGVFEEILERAQDMAAVFGGDLKGETMRLARAMQDPAQGIELLRRRLGNLSPALQFTIKGLSELGRTASAQRLILDELSRRVGGAGVAEAGGLAGQVDNLSEAWNEFLEGIGRSGLIQVAVGVIKGLTTVVEGLGKALMAARLIRPLSIPLGGLSISGLDTEAEIVRTKLEINLKLLNEITEDFKAGNLSPRRFALRGEDFNTSRKGLEDRLAAIKKLRFSLLQDGPTGETQAAIATKLDLDAVAIQKFRGVALGASPAIIDFFQNILKVETPLKIFNDGLIVTTQSFNRLNDSAKDVKRMEKLPSLLESARTSLQKFNRELEDLNRLMILAPEQMELLSQAVEKGRENLIASDPILNSFSNGIKSLGDTVTDMAIDYENAMDTLRSATFNVVKDILNAFNRLAIVNPILNALFKIGAPTLASSAGIIGGLFGGGGGTSPAGTMPTAPRAHGGGLRAGQVATVGELGVETFIPSTGGRIVPGAGNQTTIIIDARGSVGTSEVEAAIDRGIAKAAPQLIGAAVISVRDGSGRELGFLEG